MKLPLNLQGEPHELTQPGRFTPSWSAHRPDAQRVQRRRRRAQAGQTAGQWQRARAREPAQHLAAHAGARSTTLCRQTLGRARHGSALRPAAQFCGRARRREAPRGPEPGQPRQPGSHAHSAARPTRRWQDALRQTTRRSAGHQHEPGAHEFHDGRLAALGFVVAVERCQAGQGV